MASRDLLLNVDEFYNAWADPFFIRMIVDVRKKDVFTKMQDHASMAVNFDHSSDGMLFLSILPFSYVKRVSCK